jgi:hypothetical protein
MDLKQLTTAELLNLKTELERQLVEAEAGHKLLAPLSAKDAAQIKKAKIKLGLGGGAMAAGALLTPETGPIGLTLMAIGLGLSAWDAKDLIKGHAEARELKKRVEEFRVRAASIKAEVNRVIDELATRVPLKIPPPAAPPPPAPPGAQSPEIT